MKNNEQSLENAVHTFIEEKADEEESNWADAMATFIDTRLDQIER